MKFSIDTADKPFLKIAMKQEPTLAKEVIKTFAYLMNEAFDPKKGVRWVDLPKEFDKNLSFEELVQGTLRGMLDVQQINPEAYDALLAEVHPMSLMMPRKSPLDDVARLYDWRRHFGLPSDVAVNGETIATILRRILRYAKYIKMEDLQQALEYNQVASFRGLGSEQIKKMPFYPALRYQREKFGELHVGKFFDDIGFFDCGKHSSSECPACQKDLIDVNEKYKGCMYCNAGFLKE